MVQVNLLPWREQAKRIKTKKFIMEGIVFGIFAIVALIIAHIYMNSYVNSGLTLIDYMQTEINDQQNLLNSMKTQEDEEVQLEEKLKYIMNIYNNNNQVINMLKELVVLVDSDISITRVDRTNGVIRLYASTVQDQTITLFMQKIGKSKYFDQPVLVKISQENSQGKRDFELRMALKEGITNEKS